MLVSLQLASFNVSAFLGTVMLYTDGIPEALSTSLTAHHGP